MAQGLISGVRRVRRGFALLVVLLLIITLAIVVYILQREVARESFVSANLRDDLASAYLANMGLVRGQVVLRLDDKADYDSLNEPWAKPLRWSGETFGETGEAGSVKPAEPQVLISDEERKFNLLTMVRGNEEQRKRAVETFMRLVNICRREDERIKQYLDGGVRTVRRANDDTPNTDTLVRNLIKYLEERASEDSDELEFTSEKATKADQRSMKKQTPFQMLTLGELLQVEGWTHELLHGPLRVAGPESGGGDPDTRGYYELTDQEKFDRTRQQIESLDTRSRDPNPLPLIHYITLYSSGRININTCSREVLLALDARLTWDVVDRIITAREQDRRDVQAAEANGGTLPEAQPADPNAPPEDKASFRTQDLASYAAFVARASNEETQQGQQSALEGFTEEMYTAIRPWLVVRSTVFRVEASAKVGKITTTTYAIYRRTGSNQAAPAPGGTGTGGTGTGGTGTGGTGTGGTGTGGTGTGGTGTGGTGTGGTGTTRAADNSGLPDEPRIRLTLLLKDIKQN
jgi:type II secretory pathway component PulK